MTGHSSAVVRADQGGWCGMDAQRHTGTATSDARDPGVCLGIWKTSCVTNCSLCYRQEAIRTTDGRVAPKGSGARSATARGGAPLGGRERDYMTGLGASTVFGGGLAGLGRDNW
jgi:hypothetical protein